MGISAKALKSRIKSVQSTEHITRAMQLVSSSKLRRATEKMEVSNDYFHALTEVFDDAAAGCGTDLPKEYFDTQRQGKTCIIAFAGDRGLAGGFNNNVFSLVRKTEKLENVEIYPIGKRAHEYFLKKKYDVKCGLISAEGLPMDVCADIGRQIAEKYRTGEYARVILIYTTFKNMLTQNATSMQVLPFEQKERKRTGVTLYEPSASAVFSALVPEYVSGLIYCADCQSCASEQAARRNAMDSATKNAGEMIERLNLQYNRARQGAITQEITEIVAGSEQ